MSDPATQKILWWPMGPPGGDGGGGGGISPSPTTRQVAPTRIEPDLEAAKSRDDRLKRKQARSLATRLPLSEPLLKQEKLGT